MGSEKVSYWIAVGVLALFVSNNLAARHEGEIRCLAGRATAAVEQVSGQATHLIATAEMMLGRGETRFVRTQATLARTQNRLASVQAAMACREAALARLEAEHARISEMRELGGAVICPRQNLRIVIPELPKMRTGGTI